MKQSELIATAKKILRGQDQSAKELLDLAQRLARQNAFGYARRLMEAARKQPEVCREAGQRLKFAQKHALYTYKDRDLPARQRLHSALEILEEADALPTTINQETLGLAGAIHKRQWELEAQKQHLERSLAYYRRGYQQGPAGDRGYTGINAAFVLDQMASVEEAELGETEATPQSIRARRDEAKRIREDLVAVLPPLLEQPKLEWLGKEWWFYATLAEAHFGLGQHEKALHWLREGDKHGPEIPPWERSSTVSQLATLARLQGPRRASAAPEESPAWQTLIQFLGNQAGGVPTAFLGKVGLGLSGGGFRASLFHLGVLARLAELDMLRHVEVLSCVSGGAIVGAHYYLEVRNLLQRKADVDVTREDYIEIVQRVARTFLAGVQANIRTRLAANPLANLQMIFQPQRFSRTERIGRLYEEHLFSKVRDDKGAPPPLLLHQLCIQPPDEPADFAPKYDNWRRRAKVPVLILNATTLNTGHNWQFTARFMGEPPSAFDPQIDSNARLRRMYYATDAGQVPDQRQVRLGSAVAASACVPGLFDPIVRKDLYEGWTVRLVDGGVHDNQGLVSLLEQDCTVLLVSDASGQMSTEEDPSPGTLGALIRSNSILMDRVRESEYHQLAGRQKASLLRGLMFIHLKKDLEVKQVDWINCEDPQEISAPTLLSNSATALTGYGILKQVQARLASIRTDLDSFSDLEAYALMTSGYRMTESEFPKSIRGFPQPTAPPLPWHFLSVEPALQQPGTPEHKRLMELLAVAGSAAFKIWRLSHALRMLGWALGAVAAAASAWACWTWRSSPVLTIGETGLTIAAALGSLLFGKTVMRVLRCREALGRIALGAVMATLGCAGAVIHLLAFDKWYLRWGRVQAPETDKSPEEPQP